MPLRLWIFSIRGSLTLILISCSPIVRDAESLPALRE
jgi:hypothetical protein